MSKKHLMAKTTSNLPIVTKVVSMPKPVQKNIGKEDCCMDECECPVCFDDKQLNHLLHDTNKKNYKSCGHYVCEDCINGIMNNKETEDCVCPICRRPFTHYGCFDDIKAVDDYEVVFSQEAYKNQFPKNSLMRNGVKRGGKTRRRRLRRRRTNKRK